MTSDGAKIGGAPKKAGGCPILRLAYVSRAARPLTPTDLELIAAQAKRNNAEAGVTGVLVECAGEFLQILEGDACAVGRIFSRIENDRRHAETSIIAQEPVFERAFPDWSMGCFILRPEDLPRGYFFTDRNGRRRLNPDAVSLSKDLLATFYRENHDHGMARGVAERAPA